MYDNRQSERLTIGTEPSRRFEQRESALFGTPLAPERLLAPLPRDHVSGLPGQAVSSVRLTPGRGLVEREIVPTAGVSRATVRKPTRQFEADGRLPVRPGPRTAGQDHGLAGDVDRAARSARADGHRDTGDRRRRQSRRSGPPQSGPAPTTCDRQARSFSGACRRWRRRASEPRPEGLGRYSEVVRSHHAGSG